MQWEWEANHDQETNIRQPVATFRVADDGSRLDYTIVATDPVVFSAPVELERGWRWQPGLQMVEDFDCVADWEDSD